MARKPSKSPPTPTEFKTDIDHIQKSIRTPDNEKLKDIVIGEKPDLERVKEYKDKKPLLGCRKLFWKWQK